MPIRSSTFVPYLVYGVSLPCSEQLQKGTFFVVIFQNLVVNSFKRGRVFFFLLLRFSSKLAEVLAENSVQKRKKTSAFEFLDVSVSNHVSKNQATVRNNGVVLIPVLAMHLTSYLSLCGESHSRL